MKTECSNCAVEFNTGFVEDYCSQKCYIASLLEEYEDQEKTQETGIEKIRREAFMTALKENKRVFLSKRQLYEINLVLQMWENKSISLQYNSLYDYFDTKLNQLFDSQENVFVEQTKPILASSF